MDASIADIAGISLPARAELLDEMRIYISIIVEEVNR
jgi:hypothetical protein